MKRVYKGESATLLVEFINNTGEELPTGLSADMTIQFATPITLTSPIEDLKATFHLTPEQTNQRLTSYRYTIKVYNESESYVKFIPGEILIKDPYDKD